MWKENIAYHPFRHVFPLSRKTLKHLLSHLLHWHWHPERLCNGHVELQNVHRCLKSSIQIPHRADRHSRGTVLISIHPKMHQQRSQTIQHTRANLQNRKGEQQQHRQMWLFEISSVSITIHWKRKCLLTKYHLQEMSLYYFLCIPNFFSCLIEII